MVELTKEEEKKVKELLILNTTMLYETAKTLVLADEERPQERLIDNYEN